MTTLEDVTKKKSEPSEEAAAAAELVRLAMEQGLSLTGPTVCSSSSPKPFWKPH